MARKLNTDEDYFEWLKQFVIINQFPSYNKLCKELHSMPFIFYLDMDEKRKDDGEYLRYRYAISRADRGLKLYLNDAIGPCTVFEMMVALSIKLEENIMSDTRYGDRTSQWFFCMVTSLGLGYMNDDNFDKDKVFDIVRTFIHRDYQKNGKGGLFTLRHCVYDLRDVDIWCQSQWWLEELT